MTITTHPSAVERLAAALLADRLVRMPDTPWNGVTPSDTALATDILAADPTLASDIEDGTELRLLREACVNRGGRDWYIDHYADGLVSLRVWSTGGPAALAAATGPTIAAAAKACREALEAAK